MLQVRVGKIIYGPLNAVMTYSEEYMERYPIMLKGQRIIIERFAYDKGLYIFNPRVKEVIDGRSTADINFSWNTTKDRWS